MSAGRPGDVDDLDRARALGRSRQRPRRGRHCASPVDVDEHRPGAAVQDRLRGGGERVGRDDDLVARSDAQALEREVERGGRAFTATACRAPDVRRERLLERGGPGAGGQPAGVEDLEDGGALLLADPRPVERDRLVRGHAGCARPTARSGAAVEPCQRREECRAGLLVIAARPTDDELVERLEDRRIGPSRPVPGPEDLRMAGGLDLSRSRRTATRGASRRAAGRCTGSGRSPGRGRRAGRGRGPGRRSAPARPCRARTGRLPRRTATPGGSAARPPGSS